MRYHGEASYLPNSHVELPQVQRFLAHSWKLRNRCAPLLHEGQVPLHPSSSLGLCTQLVQSAGSLAADGGVWVDFLIKTNNKNSWLSRSSSTVCSLFSWCCFQLQQPTHPVTTIKNSSVIYTVWAAEWLSKKKKKNTSSENFVQSTAIYKPLSSN